MSEPIKAFSLIDSNVLVHAYNTADRRKHAIANDLLEKCWRKEVYYAVSAQNLAEFFIVVTKKVPLPLSIEQAEQIITDICLFSHWTVLSYDEKTLQKAVQLYKQSKHHFWDTLIAATMLHNGLFHIYTENGDDFKKFAGLRAENPFG